MATNATDYYYYLRLQDMLDFGNVEFNKAIKTTKTRVPRTGDGWTVYKLSDDKVFDVFIGDRVLSTEVEESGKYPIYSANVFEEFGRTNKQNVTDFSQPSIVWGIDGDWMVNCIPANKPFYPTDHCGVLRIKSEALMPDYVALALQVEGEYERFSRHNRASTQRIQNLQISIPQHAVQEAVVNQVRRVDDQLAEKRKEIMELTEAIRLKFQTVFGDVLMPGSGVERRPLGRLCVNLDSMREPITSHKRQKGSIPYYGASGIVDYVKDFLFDERLLLVSEDGANLLTRKTPIAFEVSGKTWVNNHAHVLRFDDYCMQQYVEHYLNYTDLAAYINKNANPKLTQEKLEGIAIPIPSKEALSSFAKYMDERRKQQTTLLASYNELQKSRKELIEKAFCY